MGQVFVFIDLNNNISTFDAKDTTYSKDRVANDMLLEIEAILRHLLEPRASHQPYY